MLWWIAMGCLALIVIDVLRAFSTAAYAFDRGAARIVLVGDPSEAFALRQRWPHAVLVGEALVTADDPAARVRAFFFYAREND